MSTWDRGSRPAQLGGGSMSYSVDLELDQLKCRSESACRAAAAAINTDHWMRHHVEASASGEVGRYDWHLTIEFFDGCYWHEPSARKVWLAIAPFMRDDSFL